MIRLGYSLFLYLLSPVIWLYLLFRAIKAPEYREGFFARLGFVNSNVQKNSLLIHCASVGEVRAAAPLINYFLNDKNNDLPIVISTSTPTGKAIVKELFNDSVQHVYLPIDWYGSAKRFIQSLNPKIVILMETELWMNLLSECEKKSIPCVLANARLSNKSLKKYQKYPRFSETLFDKVNIIAAQFSSDQKNFQALNIPAEKIQLVGSIKFDIALSSEIKQQQKELKKSWADNRPVWVAASIHPDEFNVVLSAHRQLLKTFPDLLLIAVPRHPEQFSVFAQACENQQLSFVSRSKKMTPEPKTQVVVGDTMGEMLLLCGVADCAFVGGSLIERGGHNPLEPLACGLPVVMGKHVFNFSDICEKLTQESLLKIIENNNELAETIKNQLTDKNKEHQHLKAIQFMQENSGCVLRLAKITNNLLSKND